MEREEQQADADRARELLAEAVRRSLERGDPDPRMRPGFFGTFRLAWQLYRLSRRLMCDTEYKRAASFNVVVEGPSSFWEACRLARANGEPAPDPRVACEVIYWPVAGAKAKVSRGWTLADALAEALAES